MEHEKKLKRSDDRENMVPAPEAWHAISARVMDYTGCENFRNGTACMNKWNSLLAEYKKINDHHESTGTSTTYFSIGPEEKEQHGLPKIFIQRHFEEMHRFLHDRPIHKPMHMRDSQDPRDSERTVHTMEEILSKPQAPEEEPLFETDPVNMHTPESLHPDFNWTSSCAEGGGLSSFEPFKPVATGGDAALRHSVTPPVRLEPLRSGVPGFAAVRPVDMPFTDFTESESDRSHRSQKLPEDKPKHSRNTGKLRKVQPEQQAALIAEEGQKAVVDSINKISETVERLEDKKGKTMQVICDKQLEYFRSRDAIINRTSKGLVKALEGLSVVLGQSARRGHAQGRERPSREDSPFEDIDPTDLSA
jgi:hypothetical protein